MCIRDRLMQSLPLGPQLPNGPLEILHGLRFGRGALQIFANQGQPVGLGEFHGRAAALDGQERQDRAGDLESAEVDVLAVDAEGLPEQLRGQLGGPCPAFEGALSTESMYSCTIALTALSTSSAWVW